MDLYSLNINGLNETKMDEIGLFLKKSNPWIVFIQETKLRQDKLRNKVVFAGYNSHLSSRSGEDNKDL